MSGPEINPADDKHPTREEWETYERDPDYDGSERYCWECGGRGYIVRCPDDMCHGQDECMHGDPPSRCWTCNKDGKREDSYL